MDQVSNKRRRDGSGENDDDHVTKFQKGLKTLKVVKVKEEEKTEADKAFEQAIEELDSFDEDPFGWNKKEEISENNN
jgi:hypothetical protein